MIVIAVGVVVVLEDGSQMKYSSRFDKSQSLLIPAYGKRAKEM